MTGKLSSSHEDPISCKMLCLLLSCNRKWNNHFSENMQSGWKVSHKICLFCLLFVFNLQIYQAFTEMLEIKFVTIFLLPVSHRPM